MSDTFPHNFRKTKINKGFQFLCCNDKSLQWNWPHWSRTLCAWQKFDGRFSLLCDCSCCLLLVYRRIYSKVTKHDKGQGNLLYTIWGVAAVALIASTIISCLVYQLGYFCIMTITPQWPELDNMQFLLYFQQHVFFVTFKALQLKKKMAEVVKKRKSAKLQTSFLCLVAFLSFFFKFNQWQVWL